MSRRHRQLYPTPPPLWWVRCLVVALACVQIIAPTWHICAMSGMDMSPKHDVTAMSCSMPQAQMEQAPSHHASLDNPPMEENCLARLLQHMLGNNQFRLVLDFSTHTVGMLHSENAVAPESPSLPTRQARAPPIWI